jgi:hypothetical protein
MIKNLQPFIVSIIVFPILALASYPVGSSFQLEASVIANAGIRSGYLTDDILAGTTGKSELGLLASRPEAHVRLTTKEESQFKLLIDFPLMSFINLGSIYGDRDQGQYAVGYDWSWGEFWVGQFDSFTNIENLDSDQRLFIRRSSSFGFHNFQTLYRGASLAINPDGAFRIDTAVTATMLSPQGFAGFGVDDIAINFRTLYKASNGTFASLTADFPMDDLIEEMTLRPGFGIKNDSWDVSLYGDLIEPFEAGAKNYTLYASAAHALTKKSWLGLRIDYGNTLFGWKTGSEEGEDQEPFHYQGYATTVTFHHDCTENIFAKAELEFRRYINSSEGSNSLNDDAEGYLRFALGARF